MSIPLQPQRIGKEANMHKNKPKLIVEQQIDHLKGKGVLFTIDTEEEALDYLRKNNNYFKLRSYRKNYDQRQDGTYVNLEFAYLRDLAIIDMRMRYCLLEMALDVEHYMRIRIIKAIEDSPDEDGYTVVADFKAQDKEGFKKSIDQAKKSPYCKDLTANYDKDCMPVWVFVEMAQFGQLVYFYKFVGKRLNLPEMTNAFYILQEIRQLRNACAHSNCLINDLRIPETGRRCDAAVSNAITLCGIKPDVRKKKTRNDRIRQIATLLYFYQAFVTSKGVMKHQHERLIETFIRRPFEHIEYYKANDLIRSTFDFFRVLIDNWYKVAYNNSIEQKS